MAAGDIVSITIAEDGWFALINIDQIGTGGAYDLGFNVTEGSASNLIKDAKIVLNVTSAGYDDTGTPTTRQRTIYGTKQIRKPYPDQATMDEAAVGPGVLIKIALSDYIYSDCTNITATMAAGVYTKDSVGNNAVADLSVTNDSIATHQKVIANWSIPGWREVEDDGSLKLSAVAFHNSAVNGNLGIACVKFSVSDGVTTTTKTISQATIDSDLNEDNKVIEFIALFSASDLSGMIPGSVLDCDFIAYPYFGDSGAVLDTSDGVNTGLTPLYSTQYNYLPNTTGDDRYYAYVDNTATGGTASTSEATAMESPFDTIAAAANAIYALRGNLERGEIRLRNDQPHTWTGGTITTGTNTKTYIRLDRWDYDGLGTQPVITNQSGSDKLGQRVWMANCEFIANDAAGFINNQTVSVFDNCTLKTLSGTPQYTGNTLWSIINCDVQDSKWATAYSNMLMQVALYRNNTGQRTASCRTILGNQTSFITIIVGGSGNATFDGMIAAFNKFTTTTRQTFANIENISHGVAFVQNACEYLPYAASEPGLQISGDGAQNNCSNVLVWNNTIVGARYNGCYLDIGEINYTKKHWSLVGNIFDDYNFKADTLVSAPNGVRVGNWSTGYGVGFIGNIDRAALYINGASGFYNSDPVNMDGFDGLDYFIGESPNLFIDYQAGYGGAGDGNYIPLADSVAVDLTTDEPLPYDLLGNDRSKSHVVGAYCFAPSFNIGNFLYRIFNNV